MRPLQPVCRFAKLCFCAVLLGTVAACVSDQGAPKPAAAAAPGAGPIDELNLLAIPVALNLDASPGLDGFVIKIFASSHKRPKPVPIDSGKIEVLMFNGIPGQTTDASGPPLRTWTYSAQELKAMEIESSIGIGYQVAATWGEAKPTAKQITVAVQYTSPQGTLVLSAPSIISVALK